MITNRPVSIWKENTMANFKVLSRYSYRESEENLEERQVNW